MAPQFNDADYQILISCLKNSSTKLAPNFEQVAKECGLKDGKAAYFRHWSMMKKLGLTGTRNQAQKPKKEAAATTKKRAAAAEETDDGNGDEDGEDGRVSDEVVTPTKKAKKSL